MSEGGAAIAALTGRIKGETKKYRLIKALKFDISIRIPQSQMKRASSHGHALQQNETMESKKTTSSAKL
jgi:hypothetical protein